MLLLKRQWSFCTIICQVSDDCRCPRLKYQSMQPMRGFKGQMLAMLSRPVLKWSAFLISFYIRFSAA